MLDGRAKAIIRAGSSELRNSNRSCDAIRSAFSSFREAFFPCVSAALPSRGSSWVPLGKLFGLINGFSVDMREYLSKVNEWIEDKGT